MADNTELKQNRWAATLPVSGGPKSHIFEQVVKLITGIAYDTVITRGLGLDEQSRFANEEIWIRGTTGTPGQRGIRIKDTTNADDFLFQQIDGDYAVYKNTNTEGSPTWTFQGFLPITLACRAYRDASKTLSDGVAWEIEWDGVTTEEHASMWAVGNPTRLVAPVKGLYAMGFNAYCNVGGQTLTTVDVSLAQIKLNGSVEYKSTETRYFHGHTIGTSYSPAFSMGVPHYELELDANDYIECSISLTGSGIAMSDFWGYLRLLRLQF